MVDLSQLSDDELMRIAGGQQQPAAAQGPDLSQFTDEQLQAMIPQETSADPGILAAIAESFTGKARKTKEIEALPDWRGNMPEFSLGEGLPAIKTAIGTMMTNPDETVKILQSNFPDVSARQDEKGNYILKSGIDQKEYAIKPGFRASDIPRAVFGALSFIPAGKATTLLGAAAANAATQAAIEASQSASGGEFNAGEVGVAGALGAAGEAAARILGVVIPGAKRLIQGKSFIPDELGELVAPVTREVAGSDLNELVRNAGGESLKANKYKRQLAELAKVNPDALSAATELGIELPPDVFSDNPQLRAIVGTIRSQKGSEAEAAWREGVINTVNKADAALDAAEASTEASVMSDKVFRALQGERDALKQQTSQAYGEVDSAIPQKTVVSKPIRTEAAAPLTEVEMSNRRAIEAVLRETGRYVEPEMASVAFEGPGFNNLQALLKQTIENQGGVKGLTSQEKALWDMTQKEEVTYGRLIREKTDLRRALRGKQTPYSTLDQSIVEGLYNAISKDQVNAVQQLAGDEIRDRLLSANLLYTKQKQLEKTLVEGFKKDFSGSIIPLMTSAVKGSAKGDVTSFNKLLSVVPENLQKEAVLSSISNYVRPATGQFKGQFGITQFDNFWSQLKARPEMASRIEQVVGSEAYGTLDALGKVSKLITRSGGEISQTGASNQAILREMRAMTLVDHLFSKVSQSVAATAGGKIFGPIGFGLGLALPKILKGPPDRIAMAGKMLNSQEFQNLIADTMLRPSPRLAAIEDFARSGQFSRFAKLVKLPSDLPSKVRWVKAALRSTADMELPQSAFQPDKVVAEVLPNGNVKTDQATRFRIMQRAGGKFRLFDPDGTVSVYGSENDAIKAATKKMRKLTNSTLQ